MRETVTKEPCGCVVDRDGLTQAFCDRHDLLAEYRANFARGIRLLAMQNALLQQARL